MNAETAQFDELRLVALPSALNCTELFARFTLTEWSLRSLAEDAAHAARQLIEAVLGSADPQSPGFLSVRLRLHGGSLMIEIESDRLERAPAVPTLEYGRTDLITLENQGTLMWCELPLPAGTTASEVPLPRREPRRSEAAARMTDDTAEVDPRVIQRLLSGLSQLSPDGPS
ncbi:hypothetical protein DFQ14_102545 [Halopolyspora algeriensis]|uniref:Uncharacterized protein n=1 Tax=Halopolyspora algeriensis TaxID=1500506 RepID=A0A368VZH1_9ACTN|nr:ATP-binding protein [Halopolyspora algeriensis]RCW46242.1 hypothetical protein DFQ14_102545 [Halopolyspora algeriensis]TQM55645.1 hypothetical protein FHU43_0420 [Halopolyspora algeriensis]